MSIKVRVKNFQSIKESEIEIDGFTVVTGSNNSGKTALMRAVGGVFTNTRGHSFVRHGASHCEVELTFEDGNIVLWEKGKNINRYTVNGKVLDKVGHGVPPEVEALGVCSITAGGNRIWPQIARQFDGQLFLINQPGSTMAEAVADAERVGQLQQALKLSESDRRKAAGELKLRNSDRKDLELELNTFEGLDDAVALVAGIEATEARCQKVLKAITGLESMLSSLTAATDVVTNLEGISQVDTAIDTDSALSLKKELGETKALLSLWEKAQSLVGGLEEITSIEVPTKQDMHPVEKLKKALQVLIDLEARKVRLDETVNTLLGRLAEISDEKTALSVEITETLGNIGYCPTCGVSTSKHNVEVACHG